jgi:Glyoxalase-like domain
VSLAAFWAEALGYDVIDAQPGQAYLRDPAGANPFLCLLEVPEPKTVKNRMHFDLVVSGKGDDDAKWQRVASEVARLVGLGATIREEHPPRFVGMSDPEGNEFDVT